jgi:hypothetical protein
LGDEVAEDPFLVVDDGEPFVASDTLGLGRPTERSKRRLD